jgi:hypothetical protein
LDLESVALCCSPPSIPTTGRDPEGRQHKPLHDCPPSKRSHDTIPLYQRDVARHRAGIVCISEAPRRGFGGVPPAQETLLDEYITCGRAIESSGRFDTPWSMGDRARDSPVHNYPPRWSVAALHPAGGRLFSS